jgi:hypothetical protein
MANKTIPELEEIDFADVDIEHLMILDTGLVTRKIRLETLAPFLFYANRRVIDVVFDGVETGEKTVDVATYVEDAREVIWMLKKPTTGEQMAIKITTPDDETVVIDSGDFALDAGTYTLLGV